MPEIGEVARIVHYLHKHIVGKTLATVKATHDENVFGKVGTSAAEFEKSLTGKKVLDVGQQGKYFWLIMSSPPHPVCHFGMAGWLKIRGEETFYYKTKKPEDLTWPPKHWKFTLETAEEPKYEAAFVDYRRFARIRLVDCAAEELRQMSPLKQNGPDPVIDRDVVTKEWLVQKLGSKKVPIKALLLDQANISGIGNWVGDEILYDARIHPEQYSNTLSATQISQLHKSLHYVTSLAVSTLADSSKFPDSWLFKHRWGKGKKDDPRQLANGAKITFLTVGGRTSAVVPSVQKKTGPVAVDVPDGKTEEHDEAQETHDETVAKTEEPKPNKKKARGKSKKGATPKSNDADPKLEEPTPPRIKPSSAAKTKTPEPLPKRTNRATKPDPSLVDDASPARKKRKPNPADVSEGSEKPGSGKQSASAESGPRRRSARVSGRGTV